MKKIIFIFVILAIVIASCEKDEGPILINLDKKDTTHYFGLVEAELIDLTKDSSSAFRIEPEIDSIVPYQFNPNYLDQFGRSWVIVKASNKRIGEYKFLSGPGGGPHYSPQIILIKGKKVNFFVGDDGMCVARRMFVFERQSIRVIDLLSAAQYGAAVRSNGLKSVMIDEEKRQLVLLYNPTGYMTGNLPDQKLIISY